MPRQVQRSRTIWQWLILIGLWTSGIVGFVGSICSITGFTIKTPPQRTDLVTARAYAQRAIELTKLPLPLWSLPASWLALWLIGKVATRTGGPEDTAQPPVNAEAEENLAVARRTADVYRDLATANEARGERLRNELTDVQANKGNSAMTSANSKTGSGKTLGKWSRPFKNPRQL